MTTNFEKIKNMSLDELTKMLDVKPCQACVYNNKDCTTYECLDGIKQWLNQEVKE